MKATKASRIEKYLKVSQDLLNERVFGGRRAAEALLGRVTYHRHERQDAHGDRASKDLPRVSELTTQTQFFQSLIEKWASAKGRGTVSMIIGESGLGKTWLMASLFRHVSDLWMKGDLYFVPILGFLTGQDLMGTESQLAAFRTSFEKKGFNKEQIEFALEQMRTALPPETSAGRRLMDLLLGDTGFRELNQRENILVLLDGLNEMPIDGKRNLEAAVVELREKNPTWQWIISGQPQIVEAVYWVKDRRPLYDTEGRPLFSLAWDFYEVQEVTEERVRDYLNIHLGQGRYQELEESLLGYLRNFDYAVRRNPRYLYHICERLKETQDVKALPKTGGMLLDEVVTKTIVDNLPLGQATAQEITTRKLILGCIALYEVLSAGKLLQWELDPAFPERHVTEWLRGFAEAAVLPASASNDTLKSIRSKGPWGYSAGNAVVFDHDTTRDYAVAYLFKYLLEDSANHSDGKFCEFLVMLLGSNRFLSKSVRITVQLASSVGSLRLPGYAVTVVTRNLIDASVFLPDVLPIALSLSKNKDKNVSEKAIQALVLRAAETDVRKNLIDLVRDYDHLTWHTVIRGLAFVAKMDPNVKSSFLQFLSDDELAWQLIDVLGDVLSEKSEPESYWRGALIEWLSNENAHVRTGAADALATVASNSDVKSALIKRLTDDDVNVRQTVIRSLARAGDDPYVKHALLKTLFKKEPIISSAAAEALATVVSDPDVKDALIQKSKDDNWLVQDAIACSLSSMSRDSNVKNVLITMLSDPKAHVRAVAARALSDIVCYPDVKTALMQRLFDVDEVVRCSAAYSLSSVVSDPYVKKLLLQKLSDKSGNVKYHSTMALQGAATEPDVKTALLKQIDDQNWILRFGTVSNLATIANDPTVAESLLSRLADTHYRVRSAAAKALAPIAYKLEALNSILPKRSSYDLYQLIIEKYFDPMLPPSSFWRGFLWAFSTNEALTHALTFYMNPTVFVSVLNSIPAQDAFQFSHYALLDGQARHTCRREDKRQFFSELKGHFPMMNGRIPCPALCIDGKPVFFNYATFCLAHLVPDIERFELLKDPDVQKTLQEIFEDHVIAPMGFPASRVAELCEESEILFCGEGIQEKTIFGSWEVFKNHLSNLIANARIHKKSVCRVMATEPADSKVKDPVIMVLDDGKGFPADKEDIEKLFKRGISRTPGGSGNGLTEGMVREFGEMGFSVCLRNCEGQWFCFEKGPTGDYCLSGPTPSPDPIAHEKQAIEAITHSSGAVVAIMR